MDVVGVDGVGVVGVNVCARGSRVLGRHSSATGPWYPVRVSLTPCKGGLLHDPRWWVGSIRLILTWLPTFTWAVVEVLESVDDC